VGPTAGDFSKSQSQSQSQLSKNFKPTLAEAQELKRDVGNIVLSTLDNIMGLDLVCFLLPCFLLDRFFFCGVMFLRCIDTDLNCIVVMMIIDPRKDWMG
jgi:hypothetical protein